MKDDTAQPDNYPNISPGRDVWGVDAQLVHEIGRMVITAGMLEGQTVEFAEMLRIAQPEAEQFKKLVEMIVKKARTSADWSGNTDTLFELEGWANDAQALMDLRNEEIHGKRFFVAKIAGEWLPTHEHIRSRVRKPQDLAEVRELRQALRHCWDQELDLMRELSELLPDPGIKFD